VIPVQPAPEPAEFDAKVRQPGLDAIAELTGVTPSRRRRGPKRKKVANRPEDILGDDFPPLWRKALPEMLSAYERRCAYLALHIEPATGDPTVDHFVPKSNAWELVYEWSNYRLAAALINSKKKGVEGILDPFEIGADWLGLELIGFQVKPGPGAVGEIASRVHDTIEKLGLNRDECCKAREAYFCAYMEGDISIDYLTVRAPVVAREMARLGFLRSQED
jgi:5-methylcytosine-specific restriction endonuclease McrA